MSLLDDVQRALSALGGHTGVYARRLSETEAAIELHADTTFTLASVVKLPLLLHVLRLAQGGHLDLAERFTQAESDRLPGSGVLTLLQPGISPTLQDLLYLMMVVSDNQATDAVLAATSKEAVEAEMHALGYDSFRMPQSIREVLYSLVPGVAPDASYAEVMAAFERPDYEPPVDALGGSATQGNRCTPRQVASMLSDLAAGKLLDEWHTTLALDILKACQTNSRIPQGVPPGTKVAHKTGTITARANDAAIVFAPSGPYVVTLFNHGEPDERKASRALARVSELVYAYYAAGD